MPVPERLAPASEHDPAIEGASGDAPYFNCVEGFKEIEVQGIRQGRRRIGKGYLFSWRC